MYPTKSELEIIEDMMKRRDIILNMEYAEKRRQESKRMKALTDASKPKTKSPWIKIACTMAEIFVLIWVLYGAYAFARYTFRHMF